MSPRQIESDRINQGLPDCNDLPHEIDKMEKLVSPNMPQNAPECPNFQTSCSQDTKPDPQATPQFQVAPAWTFDYSRSPQYQVRIKSQAQAEHAAAYDDPCCDVPRVTDSALSTVQLRAIHLLVIGRSFSQAAAELNIDRKTLFRWRSDPTFAAELQARSSELWTRADARICGLVNPSLDFLQAKLFAGNTAESFRAVQMLLTIARTRRNDNRHPVLQSPQP